MKFANLLFENIFLPASDLVTGYKTSKYFHFLLKTQRWSKNDIKLYQEKKLQNLIKHAVETVPYYKDLFNDKKININDIKTKNDLLNIPILTKEIIRNEGLNRFLSNKYSRNDLVKCSSSGSTGEPLVFYSTKDAESFMKASLIRAWYWMGYRLGDKYVKISMNPRESLIKKIQDFANNCLYLSSQQITEEIMKELIQKIIEFKPKIIRCYPVPLLFLSEILKSYSNLKIDSLSAINTTGSTLQDDIRNKIQNTFGVRIYDSYSCEGGAVFSQCEHGQNYHCSDEYAISEYLLDNISIHDSNGNIGRHITTDLNNYAFPFIRYDTQDYMKLSNESFCTCGRQLSFVEKIIGRDSDILKTPSGKYLISENFAAYFEWIPSIKQFQIYQEKINKLYMRFVVDKSYSEEIGENIYKYWKNYIGEDVEIVIELLKEIKLTPSGKRRSIIRNSEIKINNYFTK